VIVGRRSRARRFPPTSSSVAPAPPQQGRTSEAQEHLRARSHVKEQGSRSRKLSERERTCPECEQCLTGRRVNTTPGGAEARPQMKEEAQEQDAPPPMPKDPNLKQAPAHGDRADLWRTFCEEDLRSRSFVLDPALD